MIYRERRPPPELAAEIECLWSLRGSAEEGVPPQGVYPDGCVELIVHLGDPFSELDGDRRAAPQPRVFVVGPSTRPLVISAGRRVDTIGVRFRPGAAAAYLPATLEALAEQATPLDALCGAATERLLERLANAASSGSRDHVLVSFLRRRRRATPVGWIAPSVASVLASEGRVSIATLAHGVGLGARQLERGFRAHVGLSPKAFSRIVRFQSALRRLGAAATPDWIDVALDSGYFDQSHLIREFRSLAGVTPRQHCASESLARLFTSSARLAGYFGAE